MKEEYERVPRLIEEIRHVWQERLGLGQWEIEHVYLEEFYHEDSGDDFKVTATTQTRWNYEQAKIAYYLPSAIRHNDKYLERVEVHELFHVILSPEQELLYDKKDSLSSNNAFTDPENEMLQAQFDQRLELATERATKAALAGWGSVL